MILRVGARVSGELLSEIFGVDALSSAMPHLGELTELPKLDTPIARYIARLVEHLRDQRPLMQQLIVAVEGSAGGSEHHLASLLVEDKTLGGPSYVDFLCTIHKAIQHKLLE